MRITGIGDTSKSLKELRKALAELNGTIGKVEFDPHDPASIEDAIRFAHRSIDNRLGGYSRNPLIAGIAEDLKHNFRATILERAAAARLQRDEE